MKNRPLTRLQQDLLHVAAGNGPVSATDAAFHLLVRTPRCRAAMDRLVGRGLLERVYTGHDRRSLSAYTVTEAGTDALAGLDEPTGVCVFCDQPDGSPHRSVCMLSEHSTERRRQARARAGDGRA